MATKREISTRLEETERQLIFLRLRFEMQGETIEVLNRTIIRMNNTIINLVAGRGL
jgi:hypothetical protein